MLNDKTMGGSKQQEIQGGTIMLMVLVLTAMVIVFLVSVVLFSGRQFNATVEQEERERAFHAAEAGMHYALYLLNSEFLTEDVFTLLAAGEWPPQDVFHEDTGEKLGTHTLTFTSLTDGSVGKGLTVWSVGEDTRSDECQLIRAEIQRVSVFEVVYAVNAWDHLGRCNETSLEDFMSPAPIPSSPSPSLLPLPSVFPSPSL